MSMGDKRKRNNKCRNMICACTGACFVDDGTGDFAPDSDRIKLEKLRSRMLGWDDAEEEIKELQHKLEVCKNVLRFADGRCWPEVQAAIDANRSIIEPNTDSMGD